MKNRVYDFIKIFFWLNLFVVVLVAACETDETEDVNEKKAVASCEGCHTDYEHLQEVYSPDTTEPAGGCGGEAPHYEPYDRVYMGGDGYEEFKDGWHGDMSCAECHNGVDNTSDKKEAHSGDFVAHPSSDAEKNCGECHSEITEDYQTSLHHGTGQKRKVAMRHGLDGHKQFDELPQHQIEGYNKNCATCHGTCGNCHVVRPPAKGGGLSDGHKFNRNPDMLNVCVGCHVSRGGHAFLGVAPGTEPDVHLTKADFECLDCHEGAELHGNGEEVHQRYAYSELPSCDNCHPNIESSNNYHSMHMDDFNCQTCHSQEYNSCGSCHIHGEGARIPSYQDFKIAKNPLPQIKSEYKYALVRKTPAAPDSWKEYGVEHSSHFSVLPTYNYTTPHNILRWTERTDVGEGNSCYANCHVSLKDGELINKDIYLFQEDLLDYEVEATKGITVDDELPSSWFEKK